MTSKRILVRVMNHRQGLDQHEMIMADADQVALTTSNLIANLVAATGYPFAISATTMLAAGKQHGDALHATHHQDGWLLQLRVDNKKIAGVAAAANDNEPVLAQANS